MGRLDPRRWPGCALDRGCSTDSVVMKPCSVGHSRLHPEYTSSMVLPPVMTIFPEKKHRSTTGEASGR